MSLFVEHLCTYPFLQHAVVASVLASVACGIVGSFVVVRRRTYVAGAVSHCVLGGMGAARYLQTVHAMAWITPMLGATVAALAVAVLVAIITVHGGQREDTALSAVWAVGMAIGISFIMATPGYNEDLMSYLFGNILMVTRRDLWLMLAQDVIIVAVVGLFYNRFLVICFHEELARLKGIHVGLYSLVLLLLTALTVVLLVQVVGIVLVIALLALPAATAALLVKRLWQVMLVAILLSLLFTVGGIAVSYAPDLPAGATIVEIAGITYALVLIGKTARKRFRPRPH